MQYIHNDEVKVVQTDLDAEPRQLMSPHNLSNLSRGSDGSMNSNTESAIEEICQVHNDVIVAYNKKTHKLACNQCIY